MVNPKMANYKSEKLYYNLASWQGLLNEYRNQISIHRNKQKINKKSTENKQKILKKLTENKQKRKKYQTKLGHFS